MSDRLAPVHEVNALIRRAEVEGGFGAVLARGDADRGGLLLEIQERGRFFGYRERRLLADFSYGWDDVGPDRESDPAEIRAYPSRRKSSDPDLWLIELDVPDAARFIARTG